MDAQQLLAEFLGSDHGQGALSALQSQGFSQDEAMQHITAKSPGHFDPALLDIFRRCAGQFDGAFSELVE